MKHSKYVLFLLMAGIALFCAQSAGFAAQLLVNPGFEAGVGSENQATGRVWDEAGWTLSTDTTLGSGFWSGTATFCGGSKIRSGADSERLFHYGGVYAPWQPGWRTSTMGQITNVAADRDYTATAWAYVSNMATSVMADGFFLRLEVQELDAANAPIGAPHVYSLANTKDNINDWKLLWVQFHSSTSTAKVKFQLIAHWLEDVNTATVTFDDCGLSGPSPDAGATSVLLNGGFEDGYGAENTATCREFNTAGWTYLTDCLYGSGFWGSTVGWGGGPLVHTGVMGERAFAYNGVFGFPAGPRTASINQIAKVVPGGSYTPSAWVNALFLSGTSPADPLYQPFSVQLQVTEQDSGGNAIGTPKIASLDPANVNAWTQLSIPTFTATTSTAQIKFELLQTWNINHTEGNINWDDCALLGPAVAGPVMTGVVTSNGAPVGGVVIIMGNLTAVTAANGTYSLDIPSGWSGTDQVITISNDDYYTQKIYRKIPSGPFTENFDLMVRDGNLLRNAGFDNCASKTPYGAVPDGWNVDPAGTS